MAVTFPRGWKAGSAACGIKAFTAGTSAIPEGGGGPPRLAAGQSPSPASPPGGQKDDLAVIYSEHPCDAAGVFTTNKVKSATIVIDQLHLRQNRIQAVVINSGNANACTGAQGYKDALLMAKLTADRLDLDPPQVIVSSTGVIGRYLPMDTVKTGIAAACAGISADGGGAAARAIMTTDTVAKEASAEVQIGGVTIRIGGMCKGSGMIHPNMATMLSYITCDAAVEPGLLAAIVRRVADNSFNQVTVDGDSSTNDSFLILSNGAAGNLPIRPETPEAAQLEAGLLAVARDLARQIARDGEGATRLITVSVTGGASFEDARLAARSVAASSLVKSAVHGGDPNWGRIVCALGYSGADLAIDRLDLSIAGLTVFTRGAGQPVDLDAVRAAFEQPEIMIHAELGLGDATAEAWGCDLSEEYVRINADYTT